MSQQILNHMLACIERTGRGWVHGGEVLPCDVWLDGVLMTQVMAVHRKRGILRVGYYPVKLDKHKKRILFRTLRGEVRMALKITEGVA